MTDNQPLLSRRTVLTSAALLAGGSAIGGEVLAAEDGDTDSGIWSQLQADAANSGSIDMDSLGESPMRTGWQNGEIEEVGPDTVTGAVLGDGRVYMGAKILSWVAFDADDGSFIESGSGAGRAVETPAVANGMLMVPTTDGLIAWDTTNYERQWSSANMVWTAPIVADGVVYVGEDTTGDVNPNSLVAYDVADGSELWRRDVAFPSDGEPSDRDVTYEAAAAPAVVNGLVYTPTEAGILAMNTADGSTVWSSETDATCVSSVAVVDETAFVVGNIDISEDPYTETHVYAVDTANGTTNWRYQIPVVEQGLPAMRLAVDADTVCVRSTGNQSVGTLVGLDVATGDERWRKPGGLLPERDTEFTSPPLIADGNVYVSAAVDAPEVSGGGIAVFDAESGALKNWGPTATRYAMAHDGETLYTDYLPLETHPDPPAAPTPSVEPEPTTPSTCEEVPFTVTFDENLTDEERSNLLFEWDFTDDGEIDTREVGGGLSARHEYEAGEHTARLVVRNQYNQTAEATTTFDVVECTEELNPEINVVTDDPKAGEPVVFEAAGEGIFESFEWFFHGPTTVQDGDPTDQRESVVYDYSVTVLVELSVTDVYGNTEGTQIEITVDTAGDSDSSSGSDGETDGSDDTTDGNSGSDDTSGDGDTDDDSTNEDCL